MANNLFYAYANSLLNSETHPDLDTDNIKANLVDNATIAPLVASHDFLDDITTGVVTTSGNMSGASVSAGAIDYADFSFTSVSGSSCESMCFYYDTGSSATSVLIAYYDSATGLPVTPNGANINVALNASGLFKLVA